MTVAGLSVVQLLSCKALTTPQGRLLATAGNFSPHTLLEKVIVLRNLISVSCAGVEDIQWLNNYLQHKAGQCR